MKKVLALSLVLTLLGSAAVFAGGKKDAGDVHAFVFKSTGNPYGERQISGFDAGIKEQGGKTITRSPDLPRRKLRLRLLTSLSRRKSNRSVSSATILTPCSRF